MIEVAQLKIPDSFGCMSLVVDLLQYYNLRTVQMERPDGMIILRSHSLLKVNWEKDNFDIHFRHTTHLVAKRLVYLGR